MKVNNDFRENFNISSKNLVSALKATLLRNIFINPKQFLRTWMHLRRLKCTSPSD